MMAWMLCALAVAQEPVPEGPALTAPQPWQIDWTFRDREATNVARVGGILAATMPVTVLLASQDAEGPIGQGLAVVANGQLVAGPAMLAGGSLRARRALVKQGIPTPPVDGYVSWGLYGGAMSGLVLASAALTAGEDELAAGASLAGVGGYIGSIALGYVQLGVNRRHRERSGRSSGEVEHRPME